MTRVSVALLRSAALVTFVLVLVSVAGVALVSLCESRFPNWQNISLTLHWYRNAMADTPGRSALLASAAVALVAAFGSTTLGIGTGYWLARLGRRRGTRLLLVLTIPAVVPLVIMGLATGRVAHAVDGDRNLVAVVVAHVLVFSPVATAIIFHACGKLNVEAEWAAAELGASPGTILLRIVVPQIWPSVAAAAVAVYALSWDEYIVAWFLTGFDRTFPVFARQSLESTMDPSVSALGMVSGLVAVALSASVIGLARVRGKGRA